MSDDKKKRAIEICKMGRGSECCRYMAVGINGFTCLKLTNLKDVLDKRVELNTITAKGDNCDGISES